MASVRDALQQLPLGLRIEGRGGLVEYEYAARTEQRAGYCDALRLAFRQAAALLRAQGIETVLQFVDEISRSKMERVADLVVGGVR